jgi:hypothetical protein
MGRTHIITMLGTIPPVSRRLMLLTSRSTRIRDGYVMNGAFDWRRLRPGQEMPWYAHGYSNDCVAWTPNAYHYAGDPNNRY